MKQQVSAITRWIFFFTLKIYCTSPEGRQVGQAPGDATVLANLSFFCFPIFKRFFHQNYFLAFSHSNCQILLRQLNASLHGCIFHQCFWTSDKLIRSGNVLAHRQLNSLASDYKAERKNSFVTRSKKLRTICLCFRLVSPSSVAVSMWHRRSGSLELSSRTSAGRISLHRSLMKSPTRASFQYFST